MNRSINEYMYMSVHVRHAWIQREGPGGPDPPSENDIAIKFLSNTGPGPWKITKLSSQHLMLDHYRPSSLLVVIPKQKQKEKKNELDPSHKTF